MFMAEADPEPPKQSGLPNQRNKLEIGSSFGAQMFAALQRPTFGMIQMASVAMRSKGMNLRQKNGKGNRIYYYKSFHIFQLPVARLAPGSRDSAK
jgi:hypothetical protein